RHSLALGNDTVVNSFPNRSGTLQLEFVPNAARIDPNATATGFTVPNELLTLNGPGIEGIHVLPKQPLPSGATVTGALFNAAGNNAWAQNIQLWTATSTMPFDNTVWDWPTVGIGAAANSQLMITGAIKDDNLTGGSATLPPVDYSLVKVGAGRVVLAPQAIVG